MTTKNKLKTDCLRREVPLTFPDECTVEARNTTHFRTIREIKSVFSLKGARAQFQSINEIRKGYQPRSNKIKNKEGILLVNREEVNNRWQEYFE